MIPGLVLGLAASSTGADTVEWAKDWPVWRGPGSHGVAETSAPSAWSDEENVAWKVEIPGRGFSSPIVWKGVVYLTTAIPLEEAPEPEPREEGGRRGRWSSGPMVENAFVVLALDLATGKELWRREVNRATPHEGYHRTYGSHASYSPVTDGERLYASFGTWGIHALDLEAGELEWSYDIGTALTMRNSFGEGLGPVIADGVLVQVLDQEENSMAVALDLESGERRWMVERDEPSTWALPLVTEWEGETIVVTSGTRAIRAYAPADGSLIWSTGGVGLNAIPAVVRHGDDVLVMSGYREPKLKSVRLGGEGQRSDEEALRWETTKGTAYTASPVLHEGLYYAATDRGFLSCWDAATGEVHYSEQRLPRGTTLKSSPLAIGDLLYVPTESGETHLIRLGKTYEHVATNTLEGQFFVASPIAVDGKLLLRSQTHLFCIAE